MTITGRAGRASGIPMDPLRRTACLAGVLYLVTFASSIPARFYFLDPVLSDPQYILGSGDGTRVVVGAFSTWSMPSPASALPSCCSRW